MHQASGGSAGVKLLGSFLFAAPVLAAILFYAGSISTLTAFRVLRTERTDGFIERAGTPFMLNGKPDVAIHRKSLFNKSDAGTKTDSMTVN
jgi:hypothetical protein